jgi:DNA primase
MLGKAQSVLAFRVGLVLGAADTATTDGREQAYEALQEVLRGVPATPERDELVRLAASRLRLPSDAAARLAPARAPRRRATGDEPPARLRMDAAQRDERLLLALTLAAGDAGSAMLDRIPPEAFTHDELRGAHAWVRARLNRDEAPSVQDVQRLEAELVALAARHGGPEAMGEVAGRVESRWIERRLEPLKEKLAAAEITPEEMRELAELQALARSAGGAYAPRTSAT